MLIGHPPPPGVRVTLSSEDRTIEIWHPAKPAIDQITLLALGAVGIVVVLIALAFAEHTPFDLIAERTAQVWFLPPAMALSALLLFTRPASLTLDRRGFTAQRLLRRRVRWAELGGVTAGPFCLRLELRDGRRLTLPLPWWGASARRWIADILRAQIEPSYATSAMPVHAAWARRDSR